MTAPKLPWKKWPEEKPELLEMIFYVNDRRFSVQRHQYHNQVTESDLTAWGTTFWLYESELLATLPLEADEIT